MRVMATGVTPEMRAACARFSGRAIVNFSMISFDRPDTDA